MAGDNFPSLNTGERAGVSIDTKDCRRNFRAPLLHDEVEGLLALWLSRRISQWQDVVACDLRHIFGFNHINMPDSLEAVGRLSKHASVRDFADQFSILQSRMNAGQVVIDIQFRLPSLYNPACCHRTA